MSEKIGDAYVRITANGDAIDDGIRKGFKDADKGISEEGDKHAKKYGDGFSHRLDRSLLEKIRASFRKSDKGADEAGGRHAGAYGSAFSRRLDSFLKGGRGIFDKIGGDSSKLRRGLASIGSGFSSARNQMRRFSFDLDVLDDRVDKYGDRAGKVFGRGARNNFVNLFGAGVRGFVLLGNIIPKGLKALRAVNDVFGKMQDASRAAGGGIGGLARGLAAGIPSLASFAASGALLVAGLAALIVIIGPLISIISGLVAAVTALAGSLTFAAFGAVAPLVGALLPLVAGIGVTTLAFIGLDKAQKKALSAKFKPITSAFKELGKAARKTLLDDIGKSAEGLGPALLKLKPLVRGVSDAIGDVAVDFSKSLQGPGFAQFRKEMTDFLPNAVRKLGSIAGNSLGGIGGIFRALIPITNEFLGWLDRVTAKFSKWANSAKGQSAIKKFLDEAGDSAKSVGQFIEDLIKGVGRLLRAGKGTGDSIFDTMAAKLRDFLAYLKANPGKIDEWFANGKDIAEGVGNAVMGIVRVFRALDTPANRALGKSIFENFVIGAKLLSGAITMTAHGFAALLHSIATVARASGSFFSFLGKAPGFKWAKDLGHDLKGLAGDLDDAGKALTGIDKKKVKPKLKANPDALVQATNLANQKLAATNRKKTNPKIKADNSNLLANSRASVAALARIKSKKVNIQGTTSGMAAWNSAYSLYNKIHDKSVTITSTYQNNGYPGAKVTAKGGVFGYAQTRIIAEAGREAVVPLDRPLSEVDPAVRAIAAFAQGKHMAGGGTSTVKTVDVGGLHVYSNASDPRAVASEGLNYLIAKVAI